MIRKKPLPDEEYFSTFYDRPIVKLLSSSDVNEKLKKPLEEEMADEFVRLLKGGKAVKLIDQIFDREFGKQLQEHLLDYTDDAIRKIVFTEDNNEESRTYTFNNVADVDYQKIREIFQVITNDENLVKKNIDEFIKYNRRATINICDKVLGLDQGIYYCGIAKMPGIWIASSIKESLSHLIIGRKNGNSSYSRQGHLVESCSRQLLRSDSAKFLGPSKYSVTFYKKDSETQLARITIPISNFIIGINITEDLLENSFADVRVVIDAIEPRIRNFIEDHKVKDNTSILNKLWNIKKGQSESEYEKNLLDTELKRCILNTELDIRWGALSTTNGNPICTYQKEIEDIKIKGPDEVEHLVETCVRQLTRKNIANVFGPVQFTFSTYQEYLKDSDIDLVKITIPISLDEEDEYLFTFNMNMNRNTSNLINNIFKLLDNESCTKILDSITP